LADELDDPRDPAYTRYTQTELLRQHLYGLALGYAHLLQLPGADRPWRGQ
jgi:hypothetical protein